MLPDHKVILDFFGPKGWRAAHLARSIVWRILKPKRIAVAGVIFNAEGKVLLVENSYGPGWRLPGGGIEANETAIESLTRELQEEVCLTPTRLRLHGVCLQMAYGSSTQLLIYVVDGFTGEAKADGNEILQVLWADPHNLPAEALGGGRRRITEIITGAACAPRW